MARRPPTKQKQILAYLREQIVEGAFGPGTRIPTRTELESRFGVSSVTVQRALELLMADGFVEARGGQGTFVTDYPPHLYKYGIVFPFENPARQSRFWAAVQRQCATIARRGPIRIQEYLGVHHQSEGQAYQQLLVDTAEHRVAGLICATHPYWYSPDGGPERLDVPMVTLTNQAIGDRVPCVYPDAPSFYDRAIDFLAERGHRNVAFIGLPVRGELQDALIARTTEAGLTTRPEWIQGLPLHESLTAQNLIRLLVGRCQQTPPDALVITDDNLVENVTAGLAASGVRVPAELEVVAHCNFPMAPQCFVDVHRLGFDVRDLTERAFAALTAQQQGQRPPLTTFVPAVFESEIPPLEPGTSRPGAEAYDAGAPGIG